MSEKYIRENINSCNIVKNSRTYAKITSLDDAIFIRDLLIANDWNIDEIPQTIKRDDDYLILKIKLNRHLKALKSSLEIIKEILTTQNMA